MCSLFSVGSRTSTGQVSSVVCAGMRAAAKIPLPVYYPFLNQLDCSIINLMVSSNMKRQRTANFWRKKKDR